MNSRSFFVLLAVLASVFSAVAAESPPSLEKYLSGQFPDNSDVRARLFSAVIGAPRELAEAYGERVLQSRAGTVTVRTVKGADDFFVEFLNGTGSAFTQGSCIIKRSNPKGYLVQAKIYLQDDPGCYARLYTGGDGTRLDIIMYGAVVKRGLYLPELLYTVLARPFSDIVDATSRAFDWGTVFGLGDKGQSAIFAASLRGTLASAQAPVSPAGAAIPVKPAGAKPESGKASPKVALAAASPPTGLGSEPTMAVGRPYRIAATVDKAASAEGLIADLSAAGESPQELSPGSAQDLAFYDDRGDLDVRLPYGSFPRYEAGKGIPLSALRAVLYLDELSSPDSVYAALGDGLRLTVAPSYDEAGRLRFAFFSSGRELGWNDLASLRGDLPVRVIRLRASRG